MNIRSIARALGGEISGRNRVLCPGPGHGRLDRSLSVTFNGDEPIVHSFAGDDWRACKDHVTRLLGLPEWRPSQDFEERRRRQETKRALRAKTEAETEAKNTRVARLIWNGGVDPRGTAADLYLKSRGLALTADACAVLRFHPAATWHVDLDHPEFPPGRHPTLLAAFQHIETDELTGIHRIRVAQPRGIEPCMAATQMGYGPAWALGSAGAITALPVLEGIRKLLLLCENDDASRKATDGCVERWLRAGREVELVEPELGKDLNDELMGSR